MSVATTASSGNADGDETTAAGSSKAGGKAAAAGLSQGGDRGGIGGHIGSNGRQVVVVEQVVRVDNVHALDSYAQDIHILRGNAIHTIMTMMHANCRHNSFSMRGRMIGTQVRNQRNANGMRS